MELATYKRRSPRLTPLTACLAAALALGAGSAASDAKALPNQQQLGLTLQGRLWAGTAPRPQSHLTPTSLSLLDRHHPVPHQIPAVPANSVPVTNCNDSGGGSLRDALVNVAVDGDTIDLTGLSCSVITLSTGSILFTQNSITLQGSGVDYLFLSGGSGSSRVAPLLHNGTGTLTINDMTIRDGAKYFTNSQVDDARGGCVFSTGFVSLNDSEVKYCTAQNTGSTYGSLGGAVYAATGVELSNTTISDSSVSGATFGWGGAIYTHGGVTMLDSFIEGNTASDYGGGFVAQDGAMVKYSQIAGNSGTLGGGFHSRGNVTIEYSTIADNTALVSAGLDLNGYGATAPLTVLNSTVSGNNATSGDGGGISLYGGHYTARIANSTIAFNTTHYAGAVKYGAGLRANFSTIDLESTIIAGNTNDDGSGAVNDDVDGSSLTLTGANNLIVSASVTPPAGTLSVDPQLSALANNGGETETHALRVSSPAINAGNNNFNVSFDQRGPGFARVIGAAADIGAYEFNIDDVIFRDGFD